MGAANLVAASGRPGRFSKGRQVRSFCSLIPESSETGGTDRKGQPLTKAGPSRLRTSLMLAAGADRKQDPQLDRIYQESPRFCGAAATVLTPTQTGLGERLHLLSRSIDLDVFVADIGSVLKWEDLADVVLVGHSFGGNAVSGAADRVPEHIRQLVYLTQSSRRMDRAPSA